MPGFRALRRPLVAMAAGVLLAAPNGTPRSRTFEFEYIGIAGKPPEGTARLDFWAPVPHSDANQDISNLRVESEHKYETNVDRLGNRILHIRVDHPTSPVQVTLRFQVTRRQNRLDFSQPPDHFVPPASANLQYWLQPDRLVPLDDQVRKWATQVVVAAHAETDVEKARAIYNHIVETVKYDKTGNGWGRGDIYYACENRHGNCTDFAAIFIGYARALGIPARFAIGFPLPVARGAGHVSGYHCWADFYAKGIGWIPLDASEAHTTKTASNFRSDAT
jgi:transglutaminase-like putative cysteine protease